MKIKFKENYVTVKPTHEESFSSPFTGKNLKRFQVTISVKKQELSIFENELEYVKVYGITEVNTDGTEIKKYNITNTSYGYSNNSNIRTYTFELSEEEDNKLNKLLINEIELTPYEYKEVLDHDAIIISTKVTVTKEIANCIDELSNKEEEYFTVIRDGINSNPLKMRFGLNVWSEHGDDIKYRLVIVEDKYDKGKNGDWKPHNYPQTQNIQAMTLYHRSYMELLAKLFVDKGLLTNAEIEELKEKANAEKRKYVRYIYKVKDVDKEIL